jgi:hypothetical protein
MHSRSANPPGHPTGAFVFCRVGHKHLRAGVPLERVESHGPGASVRRTNNSGRLKEKHMRQQMWKTGLMTAFVVAVAGTTVFAAAAAPAPAKEPATAASTAAPAKPTAPAAPAHKELFWPELWQTLHDPTPWLHMGLDERLRFVYGQNWQTLNDDNPADHEWMFQRYRTRWWTKWTLNEDISFNTRLVWEFRTWEDPETKRQYVNPRGSENPFVTSFNADEALLDWFNVVWRNIGDIPLTATIGRQDMIFGVGWLVLDGSPLDGSRTIGTFNAARLTYEWTEANTKVDAVYVNDYPHSDHVYKPINDQFRGLMEQKEQAAILYLTNTSFKPVQLEGYFIFKQDRPLAPGDTLTNFPQIWAQDGEVYTFGAAAAGTSGDHWKYRAEGAFQTGRIAGDQPSSLPNSSPYGPKSNLLAFGTLDTIEYLFKDPHDNATHFTYEYASGDDPDTARDERFDLLWGRWPRWSELLIYTWANETRVADTTNLHRFNIGHRLNLNRQWQLSLDYHLLYADQNTGAVKSGANGINISSTEKFRGQLLASWLRYKFSDQLYGHFLAEYFVNGRDYYIAPSDDNAYFLRFNLEYIF